MTTLVHALKIFAVIFLIGGYIVFGAMGVVALAHFGTIPALLGGLVYMSAMMTAMLIFDD